MDKVDVGFICVGGNKCSTTWLSEMLRQHPDINVSSNKEPNFFSVNWEKGWEWYTRNWKDSPGIKGEFSTIYLHDVRAIERIAEFYPDAKILALLRHPLQRSVSQFRHELRSRETDDLVAFLKDYPEIVRSSIYSEKIDRLTEHFPVENIKILFQDQVKHDPINCLRSAFEFLGVDPNVVPDGAGEVIGAGFTPRSQFLENARVGAKNILEKLELYRAIVMLKRSGFAEWFRKVNSASATDPGVRKALLPHVPEFLNDLQSLKDSSAIADPKFIDEWIEDLRNS